MTEEWETRPIATSLLAATQGWTEEQWAEMAAMAWSPVVAEGGSVLGFVTDQDTTEGTA